MGDYISNECFQDFYNGLIFYGGFTQEQKDRIKNAMNFYFGYTPKED